MVDGVDEPEWRDRIQAGRPRGVPLDPSVEQVEGVDPYPTTYAADHLLLTEGARLLEILTGEAPAFEGRLCMRTYPQGETQQLRLGAHCDNTLFTLLCAWGELNLSPTPYPTPKPKP